MSKVTYLLGAGASVGDWGDNNISIENKRGVPIISKFVDSISFIVNELSVLKNPFNAHTGATNLSTTQLNELHSVFSELLQICKEYPTIDTYARQLNVSHRSDYKIIKDYDTLKKVLSTFLLLVQDPHKRDIRYDGFIASVIRDNNTFPPMTILSWNYDAQFEMAYAGYAVNGRYIPTQWKELNVFNKTYPTEYNDSNDISIFKLNGTAFFTDSNEIYEKSDGRIYSKLIDNFFGNINPDKFNLVYQLLINGTYQTSLSYVWEIDNNNNLLKNVKFRTKDTQELIVIGYSFPYVNRIVDAEIIQSMSNLKNIVIQDPEYDDIVERVISMLTPEQKTNVKCQNKTNKKQFYLPNSFE